MARLRASWRTSLPVVQQPRNPQSESIARSPYDYGLRTKSHVRGASLFHRYRGTRTRLALFRFLRPYAHRRRDALLRLGAFGEPQLRQPGGTAPDHRGVRPLGARIRYRRIPRRCRLGPAPAGAGVLAALARRAETDQTRSAAAG